MLFSTLVVETGLYEVIHFSVFCFSQLAECQCCKGKQPRSLSGPQHNNSGRVDLEIMLIYFLFFTFPSASLYVTRKKKRTVIIFDFSDKKVFADSA